MRALPPGRAGSAPAAGPQGAEDPSSPKREDAEELARVRHVQRRERNNAMVPRVTMNGAIRLWSPAIHSPGHRRSPARTGAGNGPRDGRPWARPASDAAFSAIMARSRRKRHRANGEIDAARDDDKGHPERDDPGVGDLPDDVEQVLPLQKKGSAARRRWRGWRALRRPRSALFPPAARRPGSRSCCRTRRRPCQVISRAPVTASPSSSPTMRPSRMTALGAHADDLFQLARDQDERGSLRGEIARKR